ncbi:hypothetical protein ACH4MM_23635 [Streptomyces pratensis]|uniref:hypothetical protein n=1 Tax=Streptomyces pratensis TaxID=1169025 RepID=UPI0037ACD915
MMDILPGMNPRSRMSVKADQAQAIARPAVECKCGADKCTRRQVRGPHSSRGKGLRGWRRLHNRGYAKIRVFGERAVATPKCWWPLQMLRCSTARITAIVRAVVALELAS